MRLLLPFLLIPSIYFTQLIDPIKGEPFSDRPFFDDEFVNWQQIKSLKGTFIYMSSDGSIRSTTYALFFEFDTLGRLSYQYETCKEDGTSDTTWNYYSYNGKSQLTAHATCYRSLCASNQYKWCNNGYLTINQKTNCDASGNSEFIYRDSIVTNASDDFIIQKYYNDLGGVYLIEETHIDYMKRPLNKSRRYVNTSEVWNEAYHYNPNGKLTEIKFSQGIDTLSYTQQLYDYNELGSLIKYSNVENGKLLKETDFLYNSKGILESLITQNYVTGLVTLIRFSEISFY
jgi:hypothetical protein